MLRCSHSRRVTIFRRSSDLFASDKKPAELAPDTPMGRDQWRRDVTHDRFISGTRRNQIHIDIRSGQLAACRRHTSRRASMIESRASDGVDDVERTTTALFNLIFRVRRTSSPSIKPHTDGLEVRRTLQLNPNFKLRQRTTSSKMERSTNTNQRSSSRITRTPEKK
jgi:hypothetical protein